MKKIDPKSTKQTLLIVDDNEDVRLTLQYLFSLNNFDVVLAETPFRAMDILQNRTIDLVLADMNYHKEKTSGNEGIAFIKEIKIHFPELIVIVMTAWSNVSLAVKAMQIGAQDFIEKPWENDQLVNIINEQLSFHAINKKQVIKTKQHPLEFCCYSKTFTSLLEKLQKVSKSHANIMLTGENGTGKSLLANYIHQYSPRHSAPFVTVDLGGIPEQLFESELFGHKKGAFTDARDNRIGRFETVGRGTLFLDELANMPLQHQAKLLRVLETREFESIGSNQTQTAQCRIVSATNANLAQLIQHKHFRQDLFFRLNTIELLVPPLRERREDIKPLTNYFLSNYCQDYQRDKMKISSSAMKVLMQYGWPGNIRELSHLIESTVLLCDAHYIEVKHLQFSQQNLHHANEDIVPIEIAECELLIQALQKSRGNVVQAGEFLGLSRSAMYRRLEKYEINTKKYA